MSAPSRNRKADWLWGFAVPTVAFWIMFGIQSCRDGVMRARWEKEMVNKQHAESRTND